MAVHEDLVAAVSARLGEPVDEAFLEQAYAETMAFLRVIAPNKKKDWLQWEVCPTDVQAVLVTSLARQAANPRSIRQESIGEYSYTLSSGAAGLMPFTAMEQRVIAAEAGLNSRLRSVQMSRPSLLDWTKTDVLILEDWYY